MITFIEGIKEKVEGNNPSINFNYEIRLLKNIDDDKINSKVQELIQMLSSFESRYILSLDELKGKFATWNLANAGDVIETINTHMKNRN